MVPQVGQCRDPREYHRGTATLRQATGTLQTPFSKGKGSDHGIGIDRNKGDLNLKDSRTKEKQGG